MWRDDRFRTTTIVVEVDGHRIVLDNLGMWRVAGPRTPWARELLRWARRFARLADPSGSDPYPALTVARYVAQMLGGKVIRYDPPVMDETPGVVF